MPTQHDRRDRPRSRERDIKEEVKKLVPFLGKEKASRLEAAYLFGDENYREKILEIIDGIKAMTVADSDLSESVLIEPPSREVAGKGSINFGEVLYGKKAFYPLKLDKQDFLTHTAIFGSSGSGKTNIIHNLVKSLAEKDVPILIFDFSKRNYRDMLTIPELKEKMRVYTIGRNIVPFRFNPLVPPEGIQISQWAKEFAEVFDHAYWLLGGGRHIILKALDDLYTHTAPSYPRIKDIRTWVERLSVSTNTSRERNWTATASRPLESLCFRETGEIFDCERGISPAEFFDPAKSGVTVLEIDALSNDDKTFFIEIMLQWIRDWMLVSNRREKLNGVIILEEAHHVLNREKTKKLGIESVTDLIFREIRELGIGMIYVDQHPSMISYPALGNTSTHVYMNLGLDTKYSSDIEDAASMLGLNEEDRSYIRRLPTGHAFVLIRKSSFPNPFLVKFPLAIAERGKVDDATLRKEMERKILQVIEEKRTMLEANVKSRSASGRGTRQAQTNEMKTIEEKQLEEKMRKVTNNGWRILEVLRNSEASYMSTLAKSMKMSNRVFRQDVERLLQLGLVGFRQARVYKQKAVYYFLTHEAELMLALKTGRLAPDDMHAVKDFQQKALDKLWKKFDVVENDEKGTVVLAKEGREIAVHLVDFVNGGKIYELIKGSMEAEMHFVCASERIKNSLLQQAAKYSFSHPSDHFTVFLRTLDGLDKESKRGGEFEKVEFGS